MDVYELVAFTSQFILVGAVFESICILIGYVLFNVFKLFE